jgi:hypothetical protein
LELFVSTNNAKNYLAVLTDVDLSDHGAFV